VGQTATKNVREELTAKIALKHATATVPCVFQKMADVSATSVS